MDGASILLVVAALGVSFGWQPDQDDPQAYEVTAQIEPELLDVLKSGRSVPIEAHVPADVAPIRKVRIVVGNATLARETIATTAAKPAERVVRGQEPSPQAHTANYEESDPWTSDRYPDGTTAPPPDARQFDQRGATIGVDSIRTAQAPPSPWDRAQTAVNESSNSLRDGVESGIRQANDQYQSLSNQLSTSANNAGQAVNQQYQNLTGGTSRQPSSSWPAPPPNASATTAPTTITAPPTVSAAPPLGSAPASRTASTATWSSIRPELAPPRLMNPPLAPLSTTGAGTRVASNPSGPTIPSLESPPLHSVLSDPAANRNLPPPPANNSQPNWASGWGSASGTPAPATIGNTAGNPQTPWGTTSTTATPTSTNNAQPPKDLWADFPPPRQSTTPAAAQPQDVRYTTQPPANQQPVAGPQPPNITTASVTPPATSQVTPPTEQLPWIPLLVVSVSLAGSLGANLFLGWSYADARYRYRNLVRKTTNSFHRATGAVA